MFGNFAGQAGIIASNSISSPNIIEPSLTWNFSGVVVLDFLPPGLENFNDRPRINIWRDVNGQPDFDYLKFVSGGLNMLSPAPTGRLIQPWGNRNTGQITFPRTSIGENIIAGVDLFTHNFAPPVILSPPIQEWVIDNTSVVGEIKYQYRFKTGQKYPNINIELDYLNQCKPVNIPSCDPIKEVLIFIGTGTNGCPIFSCRDRETYATFSEAGVLYSPTTTWNNGTGRANFGVWNIITGSGAFRSIPFLSNNFPAGRPSIGNNVFFFVGNSGSISTGHRIDFNLIERMTKNSKLSLDISYGWNAGRREVIFRGANNNVAQYRFFHGNVNDELRYFRSGITNGTPGLSTNGVQLTGSAFTRAFNYELIHLGTGMQINVRSPNTGPNQNLIYSDTVNGTIDWSRFITGISFVTSNLPNISQVDYNNYGIYFNNIKYQIFPGIPELFAKDISTVSYTLSWNDIISATGYNFDVATNIDFTNFLSGYSNRTVNTIVNNVNITGLNGGTSYFARARAINSNGTGEWSNILETKTFSSINRYQYSNWGASNCSTQEVFSYTNTTQEPQILKIQGLVDDDLLINGIIYESGMYPYPWGLLMTCPYSHPINGAHTITPTGINVDPNSTVTVEAFSYQGNLAYDIEVFNLPSSNEFWNVNIQTTAPNQTFGININGTSLNIIVDWGDGSPIQTFTSAGEKSKTYSNAGDYIIKIKGSFGPEGPNIFSTFGIINLGLNYASFAEKSRVKSIGPIPHMPGLTSLSYAFANCTSLTVIPPNLFAANKKINSLTNCFEGCTSLTEVPANLFVNNPWIGSFAGCFEGCTSLNTITSSDLFSNNIIMTTYDFDGAEFGSMFKNCTSLTNVPSNFFQSALNVQSFDQCFEGVTLTTNSYSNLLINMASNSAARPPLVPFGGGNSKYNLAGQVAKQILEDINWVFYDSGLEYNTTSWELLMFMDSVNQNVGINLMEGINPNITIDWGDGTVENFTTLGDKVHTYSSAGYSSVKIGGSFASSGGISLRGPFLIPSRIVDVASPLPVLNGLRSFNFTFSNAKIASIPSNLFVNYPNINFMAFTFTECRSITTIPSDLFASNTGITTFSYCFADCSNLQSVPSGLFRNNLVSPNFNDLFFRCTSLTTIPPNLFRNNIIIDSFANCFYNVPLTVDSYSNLLIDLASNANQRPNNVSFNANISKYNLAGQTARQTLQAKNWTFIDSGLA
jgi:hypothetical protein